MWWAVGILAYLIILIVGVLFFRAAAQADDRISHLEGYPIAPEKFSLPLTTSEDDTPLRKASGG